MHSRSSKSDSADGSISDSRSIGKSGEGKVRRQRGGCRSLIRKAWDFTKLVFFTLLHVYRSLTAFWSQMNVCMLPALGELDHQEEQEAEEARQQELEQNSQSSSKSPKRKQVSKKD